MICGTLFFLLLVSLLSGPLTVSHGLMLPPGARERCYSFATSLRKSLDGEFGAADIREESSPSKARKIESEGIYPSVKVKPDISLQPTEKKIVNSVSTWKKKN